MSIRPQPHNRSVTIALSAIVLLLLLLPPPTQPTYSNTHQPLPLQKSSTPPYNLIFISIDMWNPFETTPQSMPFFTSLKNTSIVFNNFFAEAVYSEDVFFQQTFSSNAKLSTLNTSGRTNIQNTHPPLSTILKQAGYYTQLDTNIRVLLEKSNAEKVRHNQTVKPGDVFLASGFDKFNFNPAISHPDLKRLSRLRPFYVHIGIWNLHSAFSLPSSPSISPFGNLEAVRTFNNTYYAWDDHFQTLNHTISSNLSAQLQSSYRNRLSKLDRYISTIFSSLSTLNLTNSTILVICGLHSMPLGAHETVLLADLTNEWLKTPCLIHDPSRPPETISPLVSSLDVKPILLELLHLPSPPPTNRDGFTLSELRAGKRNYAITSMTNIREIDVYANFSGFFPEPPTHALALLKPVLGPYDTFDPADVDLTNLAIQNLTWKLIYRKDSTLGNRTWWSFISGKNIAYPRYQLYHLPSDPREHNDLSSKYPRIVTRLLTAATQQNTPKNPHYQPNPLRTPYP